MPEISKFEYPFDNAMFDPVRRLRVSMHTGSQHLELLSNRSEPVGMFVGVYHDPEIEMGHYSMPRPLDPILKDQAWYRKSYRPDRTLPFVSKRSKRLIRASCYAHDCGENMRLKVWGDGRAFHSYWLRGEIESYRIPLVSDDVSSMYIDVFKAFPGLRSLRDPSLSPRRFERARIIEMCVTTGALTQGFGRLASEYPEIEDGWHCLSTWPM